MPNSTEENQWTIRLVFLVDSLSLYLNTFFSHGECFLCTLLLYQALFSESFLTLVCLIKSLTNMFLRFLLRLLCSFWVSCVDSCASERSPPWKFRIYLHSVAHTFQLFYVRKVSVFSWDNFCEDSKIYLIKLFLCAPLILHLILCLTLLRKRVSSLNSRLSSGVQIFRDQDFFFT